MFGWDSQRPCLPYRFCFLFPTKTGECSKMKMQSKDEWCAGNARHAPPERCGRKDRDRY